MPTQKRWFTCSHGTHKAPGPVSGSRQGNRGTRNEVPYLTSQQSLPALPKCQATLPGYTSVRTQCLLPQNFLEITAGQEMSPHGMGNESRAGFPEAACDLELGDRHRCLTEEIKTTFIIHKADGTPGP